MQRIRSVLSEEPDMSDYLATKRSGTEVLENIYDKENYHLCVDNIQP